ncbi:hypothetical protein HAX54_026656 [Datura stramonium]|uniref:Uncharacterized protein n=1 Tax=Datura stramonium TaxID=4076 RepID=A0ABS8V4E4_DATST|nr:hypothetical protein [Datura stramonium]
MPNDSKKRMILLDRTKKHVKRQGFVVRKATKETQNPPSTRENMIGDASEDDEIGVHEEPGSLEVDGEGNKAIAGEAKGTQKGGSSLDELVKIVDSEIEC